MINALRITKDTVPGGVSGVVAGGGGDAGCSGEFDDRDGEVRSMAMTWGPLPVRTWQWSSR
jgi:hypothetical protein